MPFTHLKEIDMHCEIFNEINSYARTLVPTVVQWHGKTEFKYHFRFSPFFALLKRISTFRFSFSYGALKTDLNFVFRFCVALENGIH